jgi:hypothetical protein
MKAPAEVLTAADGWMPIETAEKVAGIEILGTRWGFDGKGKATCIQEPFISFWSPTLNKFYCSPTHWIPSPKPPVSHAHDAVQS